MPVIEREIVLNTQVSDKTAKVNALLKLVSIVIRHVFQVKDERNIDLCNKSALGRITKLLVKAPLLSIVGDCTTYLEFTVISHTLSQFNKEIESV